MWIFIDGEYNDDLKRLKSRPSPESKREGESVRRVLEESIDVLELSLSRRS